MPSEKVLELKKQKVADLSAQLKNACAGVVVDYKGINVADDTKLRKELREAGVHYAVVKNTLLHLAVQDAGLQELDNVLSGTTAIALSEDDYVAPARILCKFADASKTFTVKSGFLDGDVIGLEKINSLAKLPSREILLCTRDSGDCRQIRRSRSRTGRGSGRGVIARLYCNRPSYNMK